MTKPRPCSLSEARAAKSRVLNVFRELASVVGVGITRTDDGYAVKVNLESGPGEGVALPTSVDGVPVQVEVVGTIHKN